VTADRQFVWAAAVSVAFLPILYPVLGLRRIVRGVRPPAGYWRRRPILNLLETNLGMWLNVALAVAAAVLLDGGSPAAWPMILAAAAVDFLYTLWILAFTPSDWWHGLATGIAVFFYAFASVVA